MTSAIPFFRLAVTGLLEDAIRRYLSLDPASRSYLRPLAGKVIVLNFTPPGYLIHLGPTDTGIQFLNEFQGDADATLIGSPLAFARLGLGASPRRFLVTGEIRVEGDTETARRFQALFEKLDIDWEAQLARLAGETLAGSFFSLLRTGRGWSRDTAEAFRLNLIEYLQEETHDLPARAEAAIFYQDVDRTRADSDRLEARLRRLQAVFKPSA